ncbi:hypothetical protein DRW07_07775 [Alteromonas sediminis]|uniref:Sulfurtransferase n=1 Tax=Alteromonas sediminis TaxID=2259342 RepID=A0A3N5Y2W5_9ALTE|nr:rhodanese-like domain-containing protein [Alteromonas sediminis]RPJ67413.1 hypothetical protein DRW07_07775 [Alteromonas sediminis]
MKRVGSNQKPQLLDNESCDFVFDFDQFGTTMPSAEQWLHTTKDIGLDKDTEIHIVEAGDVFCGPRLAFMLRSTGFQQCQSESIFVAPDTLGFNGFVGKETVLAAMHASNQIIDVRSVARFSGEEDDPRPHVSVGHIPGSINLHYQTLINPESPRNLRDLTELASLFSVQNVDLTQPIIFSCGSGITACIGALAALALGANDVRVYDGSWSEWGADPSLPKAKKQ